ncbi:hypothetical protein H696_04580 [Fonticula alba]|uniref:Magnesium transporter n=1 Tax=Fonticula alba TaxID=691883 RepID=A0A058Z4V8_FONAL|nr:hypothetical protein H696_04580 [Fonticula alba]KCV69166.1 hypothetical protein H696_04580 [Fonticula alba]|eukprot:XP_009496737.1 hypothetical protein H696_04580 [Fonticula alba]
MLRAAREAPRSIAAVIAPRPSPSLAWRPPASGITAGAARRTFASGVGSLPGASTSSSPVPPPPPPPPPGVKLDQPDRPIRLPRQLPLGFRLRRSLRRLFNSGQEYPTHSLFGRSAAAISGRGIGLGLAPGPSLWSTLLDGGQPAPVSENWGPAGGPGYGQYGNAAGVGSAGGISHPPQPFFDVPSSFPDERSLSPLNDGYSIHLAYERSLQSRRGHYSAVRAADHRTARAIPSSRSEKASPSRLNLPFDQRPNDPRGIDFSPAFGYSLAGLGGSPGGGHMASFSANAYSLSQHLDSGGRFGGSAGAAAGASAGVGAGRPDAGAAAHTHTGTDAAPRPPYGNAPLNPANRHASGTSPPAGDRVGPNSAAPESSLSSARAAQARRLGITLRTIEFDAAGRMADSFSLYAKSDLCSIHGLRPRDLRTINSYRDQAPSILVRSNAIIVNIEHAKALIKHNCVLLFDPMDSSTRHAQLRLMADLRQRLSEPDPSQPQAFESFNSDPLPYELRALEAILESVTLSLRDQYNQFAPKGHALLRRLAGSTDRVLLVQVLELSKRLTRFEARLNAVQASLMDILNANDDMAGMYLTVRAQSGKAQPVDVHEDVEFMFEFYTKQIEELANAVTEMISNIRSTQSIVRIELDSQRNSLLLLELRLAIGTFAVGCGALGAGLFGMNLEIPLTGHERPDHAHADAFGHGTVPFLTETPASYTTLSAQEAALFSHRTGSSESIALPGPAAGQAGPPVPAGASPAGYADVTSQIHAALDRAAAAGAPTPPIGTSASTSSVLDVLHQAASTSAHTVPVLNNNGTLFVVVSSLLFMSVAVISWRLVRIMERVAQSPPSAGSAAIVPSVGGVGAAAGAGAAVAGPYHPSLSGGGGGGGGGGGSTGSSSTGIDGASNSIPLGSGGTSSTSGELDLPPGFGVGVFGGLPSAAGSPNGSTDDYTVRRYSTYSFRHTPGFGDRSAPGPGAASPADYEPLFPPAAASSPASSPFDESDPWSSRRG